MLKLQSIAESGCHVLDTVTIPPNVFISITVNSSSYILNDFLLQTSLVNVKLPLAFVVVVSISEPFLFIRYC